MVIFCFVPVHLKHHDTFSPFIGGHGEENVRAHCPDSMLVCHLRWKWEPTAPIFSQKVGVPWMEIVVFVTECVASIFLEPSCKRDMTERSLTGS